MERGYWSSEEADYLLAGIQDYWDILKTKISLLIADGVAWDEYRLSSAKNATWYGDYYS